MRRPRLATIRSLREFFVADENKRGSMLLVSVP